MGYGKFTVEILQGLPASGKTYYAQRQVQQNANKLVFDFKDLTGILHPNFKQGEWLIVDGLFLTTKSLINGLKMLEKNYLRYTDRIIITHFKEDRKTCLTNDRDGSNIDMITQAEYEYPDMKKLREEFPDIDEFELREEEVILKPDWLAESNSEERKYIFGNEIFSEAWLVEGVWKSNSEPQEEKREFYELEKWVMAHYPEISLETWLEVRDRFVKIKALNNYSYSKEYYVADLQAVEDFLKKRETTPVVLLSIEKHKKKRA